MKRMLMVASDLLGNIKKYDVQLKMISDELEFKFLKATKLE